MYKGSLGLVIIFIIMLSFLGVFIIYYDEIRIWVQVAYLECDRCKHDQEWKSKTGKRNAMNAMKAT